MSYLSGMKKIAAFVVLISTVLVIPPASAATIEDKITYKKKVLLTYKVVDTIDLKATGCKEYEIEYVIDKSIAYPAAYVSFGFSSKANNVSQSENVQPGDGKGSNGKDPWVGTKDLTFCGKAQQYINEYGDKAEAAATPVGKYKLIARLTFLKPKLLTVSSKEHVITVK
jgi:hypothetical protein